MHFIYIYNIKRILYALLNINIVYHYIFSAPNLFLHKLSHDDPALKFPQRFLDSLHCKGFAVN